MIILIGNTVNDYIEVIISNSINPMTIMFFPPKKVPSMSISGLPLPMLETNEEFTRSKLYTRVSIYIYLVIAL